MASLVQQITILPETVDDDLKETLVQIAKNDPALKVCNLNMSLPSLDEDRTAVLKLLSKAIENNSNLLQLTLMNNGINDELLEILAVGLEKNSTLTKVDLGFNQISDAGMERLIKVLEQNSTLKEMPLFQNEGNDAPVQALIGQDRRSSKALEAQVLRLQAIIEEQKKEIEGLRSANDECRNRETRLRTDYEVLQDKEKSTAANSERLVGEIESLKAKLKESEYRALSGSARAKPDTKMRTISLENIQVQEKLAETGGSSASVFSCTVDGWGCAMKEMDMLELSSSHSFDSEIHLLESLPYHNNICRYLFHDNRNNKLRLFMTKYHSSLRKVIHQRKQELDRNRNKYFSPEEILQMCLDIVKGLAFLKQHNIIHRDLKTDNIFVTLNERKEIASLAIGDFDTAKRISVSNQAKTVLGTPGYIAPEVLKNNGSYTFQADVFSFGMVMYELLSLKMPYEDEAVPYMVAAQIVKGQKPTLPDLDSSYDELIELYHACTALDPVVRPDVYAIKEHIVKML